MGKYSTYQQVEQRKSKVESNQKMPRRRRSQLNPPKQQKTSRCLGEIHNNTPQHVLSPAPETFPAQEKCSSKRQKVENLRSTTLLHRSNTKPVTTAHNFAPSPLPNHRLPPPDQDNTSVWEVVMAKAKANQAAQTASTNPKTYCSSASRGTDRCADMLYNIGIDLPGPEEPPKFWDSTGPRAFPGFQSQETISAYVAQFNLDEAREFAAFFEKWLTRINANEADIRQYLAENLFPERKFREFLHTAQWTANDKLDQNALQRILEQSHQIQNHDPAELHHNILSFPIVRLSPSDRIQGLLGDKNTPQSMPAEIDLRGRCDIVFGLTEECMKQNIRETELRVPLYYRSSGIFGIFLRVELKRLQGDHRTAVHQFAIAAYLELFRRARMALPYGRCALDLSDSSHNLRHYGYVICRQHVSIWEMKVERYREAKGTEESYSDKNFLRFPCRRLRELSLFKAEDVQEFCQWHAAILAWGLHVYATQYLCDLDLSFQCDSLTRSYTDTVGPGALDVDKFLGLDPEGNIMIREYLHVLERNVHQQYKVWSLIIELFYMLLTSSYQSAIITPLSTTVPQSLNTRSRRSSSIPRTRNAEKEPALSNRVNKRGKKGKGSTLPRRLSQRLAKQKVQTGA